MRNLELIKEIKVKDNTFILNSNEIDKLELNENKNYVKTVLSKLKDSFTKLKIKYIVGEFSGGNDDGGFDSVYLANAKLDKVEISEQDKNLFKQWVDYKKIYTYEDEKDKKISVYSTNTDKMVNVLDDLEDLLYKAGCLEEYGSFAGEFSVRGTVKLNVLTHKWELTGEQSVESYQDVTESGEL
jgi:hypothetical protein